VHRRILVILLPVLGDVLLGTPLLAALRRAYPQARIDVLVRAGCGAMLDGNPDIDRVIESEKHRGLMGYLRLLGRILRRYDLVVSNALSDRAAIYAWLAAPERVTWADPGPAGNWKRRIYQRWPERAGAVNHPLQINGWLAELLALPPPGPLVLPRCPGAAGRIRALLGDQDDRPLALLHPEGGMPYKRWPDANWRELAGELSRRGYRLVVTGGSAPAEREYLERLFANGPPVCIAAGRLRLGDLPELFSHAELYVGVDTSVTHMAAGFGLPTIALFGPEDPRAWGPWPRQPPGGPAPDYRPAGHCAAGNVRILHAQLDCVPCRRMGCEHRPDSPSRCLEALKTGDVLAASDELLRPDAPAPAGRRAVIRELRHVHIVEPAPNPGHGPVWLRHVIDALRGHVPRLTVSCPDHPDYRSLAESDGGDGISWRRYAWRRGRDAIAGGLATAAALDAELTLFTDLGWLLRHARGDLRRRTGTPIWGIWFNPPAPETGRPGPLPALGRRARLHRREQRVLTAAPRWLAGVLVLDEALATRFAPQPGLRVGILPDPWPGAPPLPQAEARRRLDLPAAARLYLHVGVAAARKGLGDAIAAWSGLPAADRPILLRVGPVTPAQRDAMAELIASGDAILREARASDAELDHYLCACDWLLLPYRRHEGSSGLLTGAAAAGRPVIAADYGVIGKRVREAGLGLLYPHCSIDGLRACVQVSMRTGPDRFAESLARYASAHDHAHFAAALRAALDLG